MFDSETAETATPVIAVLPDAVIDQIAAGEVVERPASVVKELVENSLDANATDIEVEITEGGLASVAVHDNGVGMDPGSAQISLLRHATSKIRSADDLTTVSTLGFRGEALPSIASVSKLELITRRKDSSEAVRLVVSGGHVEKIESAGRASGTSVTSRDLFFNLPARRKFMKTATSESRKVAALMTELALSRPGVGFRYHSEGRQVFNVAPASTLTDRVGDLLGRALSRAMLGLEGQLDYVTVTGLVGRPDLSKSGRHHVYLLVNGRRVQDRSLFHAITAGYGRYLPDGRFPVAVVQLSLPPEELDVNVHPAKTEVRFVHPRLVYDAVFYTVNRALSGGGALASLSLGDARRLDPTPLHSGLETLSDKARFVLQGIRTPGTAGVNFINALYQPQPTNTSLESGSASWPNVSDARPATSGSKTFFQFDRVYIVAQTEDALVIMDQHTAHERVLFEAVQKGLHSDLLSMQTLLFPLTVELDPQAFALFESGKDLFDRVGFAVRPFGPCTVLMEGAPSILGERSPERYFREMLDSLKSELGSGRDRISAMAASFACRAAVKSGDRLSETEMAALFERLLASDEPFTCPHGRPTVVRLSRQELDRKFGRT